jgi:lysophospholipase L1-like esterase
MNAWQNKKWYAYGTSITSDAVSTGRIGWRINGTGYSGRMGYYVEHLASLSGMQAFNFGKGGVGIVPSLHPEDNNKMRTMTLLDGKADADLITLELIPNDMGNAPLGETDDKSDATFSGNLNQIIEYLLKNTRAKIVLLIAVRPRYSHLGPEQKYTPDSEYIKEWMRYEERVEQIAKMHSIPCFNAPKEAGLSYYRVENDDGYYYNDNIHLANEGGRIVANYFWSKLKNLSPDW